MQRYQINVNELICRWRNKNKINKHFKNVAIVLSIECLDNT